MSEAKELTVMPDAFIGMVERLAATPGINVDVMRQILDMQERVLDREARLEYADGMREVQSELDRHIGKNQNNPQTKSRYADLAKILDVAKPIYTKHGFNFDFSEGETAKEDHMRVVCVVTHLRGHAETRFMDVPVTTKGTKGNEFMTPTHAALSAFSYGRRVLQCGILNIATGDDDGNAASPVADALTPITTEQAAWLKEKLMATNSDTKMFLAHIGFPDTPVDDLPSAVWNKARNTMIAKEKKLGSA